MHPIKLEKEHTCVSKLATSMDELPLDTVVKIFLRLPTKSLACCKCVSKLWSEIIEDPHVAVMHVRERMLVLVRDVGIHETGRIHMLERKQTKTRKRTRSHKRPLQLASLEVMEFEPGLDRLAIKGCCNGLLYLAGRDWDHEDAGYMVMNPLRKEITYKLPAMEVSFPELPALSARGLGFDDSANTFKMVVVLDYMSDGIRYIRTMIHVLGTRWWREIPKLPPYSICGDAVFAHGFLYWLSGRAKSNREVIFFDVKEEEFGVIYPPEKRKGGMRGRSQLFDLNGEVGLVRKYDYRSMEIWVMKEHEKKAWTMYCMFEIEEPLLSESYGGLIRVLGVWNNEGDILMMDGGKLFVYILKTGRIRCVEMGGVKGSLPDIRIYRSSLFSISRNITGASSSSRNITGASSSSRNITGAS